MRAFVELKWAFSEKTESLSNARNHILLQIILVAWPASFGLEFVVKVPVRFLCPLQIIIAVLRASI